MIQDLSLDWPFLKIAINRVSSIDLPRLNLKTKAHAKQFLASYGYDLDDPIVREEVWRIYFQSIAFLRGQLLYENEGEKIPNEFLERGPNSDILKLLLDASTPLEAPREERIKGLWACAILRIMHVISHLDNDVKLDHFQYAREQIFERFDKVILPVAPRRWVLGEGDDAIPLLRYTKKLRKDRNSIIIKLLAKPMVMAEEIYDRLGIRLVTENRYDCFRLLQKLIDKGVISAVNVNPNRGINSLLPLNYLEDLTTQLRTELERGEISLQAAKARLQKLDEEYIAPSDYSRNPNTSPWYRAVQLTCRQLIHAPDSTFRFWNEIKDKLSEDPLVAQALKKIPITVREKRSFYYPFEIQIMDKASYLESIGGRSRHREYKAKQRLMARNRVLRDLV